MYEDIKENLKLVVCGGGVVVDIAAGIIAAEIINAILPGPKNVIRTIGAISIGSAVGYYARQAFVTTWESNIDSAFDLIDFIKKQNDFKKKCILLSTKKS